MQYQASPSQKRRGCGTAAHVSFHSQEIFLETRGISVHVGAIDIDDSNDMTASLQVLHLPELLDLIVDALPLPALLRSRRVSHLWRETIQSCSVYSSIKTNPRIEMGFQLPTCCSVSNTPQLEVALTLQYDQPVTVRTRPSCFSFGPSGFAYKTASGTTEPIRLPKASIPFQISWRAHKAPLSHKTEEQWVTLLPGVPYKMSWSFFRLGPSDSTHILQNDVGKKFTLHVLPECTLKSYIGAKKSLMVMLDRGESLEEFSIPPLALVGEEGLQYCVVD